MPDQHLPGQFTQSQLFYEYPWLSDTFIAGSWIEVASDIDGLKDYTEFLLN
jgi:hypothetical protein